MDKNVDNLINDLKEKQAQTNKKVFNSLCFLIIISILFYCLTIFLIMKYINNGNTQSIFVIISTILLAISTFPFFKFELNVGFYECSFCHHKFVPFFTDFAFSTHLLFRRYLRCPKCHKSSYCKKTF